MSHIILIFALDTKWDLILMRLCHAVPLVYESQSICKRTSVKCWIISHQISPQKTSMSFEKGPFQKERRVFQSTNFSGNHVSNVQNPYVIPLY